MPYAEALYCKGNALKALGKTAEANDVLAYLKCASLAWREMACLLSS
jgi:hypothetical protein